jgi:hypothetical protein
VNKEFLKLTGRVVSVNAADQSFLIESEQSHSRLRVYADDALYKSFDRALGRLYFPGGKGGELTGTFYLQGRVLLHFELLSRLDIARAFSAVKCSPEDCQSIRDLFSLVGISLVRQLNYTTGRGFLNKEARHEGL